MRISHVGIKNFKGIEEIEIDFSKPPKSSVYTLVGLNESGKTTVLEAMTSLQYRTETLEGIGLDAASIDNPQELIPISKQENFNGNVEIKMKFDLGDNDRAALRRHLIKEAGFHLEKDVDCITITQQSIFQDSVYVETKFYWDWELRGKTKRQKLTRRLSGSNETWQSAVRFIKARIPSILYFPNFLFDLPDKIYLEKATHDPEKHEFYCRILQDILDSLDNSTTLDRHITARIKSDSRDEKRYLESLCHKMGQRITRAVFTSWDKVFKTTTTNKRISVTSGRDEGAGQCYLEIKLQDGDDVYKISERSVGFRWFFAFLLLTYFRPHRKDSPEPPIFLFDEPASNLHPSAQAELLQCFADLAKTSALIYATHSHHLISPDWLDTTFVVKNEGLDYESLAADYSAKRTRISVEPYRQFAGTHPGQSSYYQPILDILDYCPSTIAYEIPALMVEGKTDFYILNLANRLLRQEPSGWLIAPGMGAGKLDTLIRLYLTWGLKFVVLLDSDAAGTKEKNRYEAELGAAVNNKVFTLSDVDATFSGKRIEDIFAAEERLAVQKEAYPTATKYNKTHFNRAIQELYLTGGQVKWSAQTQQRFNDIFQFAEKMLTS